MTRWPLIVLVFAACTAEAPKPQPASGPQSVKPGVNKPFLDPKLDVNDFIDRFEGESREVYRERKTLTAALALKPGQRVADIGAGTGLFEPFFAAAVGPEGKVYALDIAKPFVELIRQRARERGLTQIEARVCKDDDIGLAAGSIDAAFVCDTYHHFEFPKPTLASIHKALKPGGALMVVDFERIPGTSRDWILTEIQ